MVLLVAGSAPVGCERDADTLTAHSTVRLPPGSSKRRRGLCPCYPAGDRASCTRARCEAREGTAQGKTRN